MQIEEAIQEERVDNESYKRLARRMLLERVTEIATIRGATGKDNEAADIRRAKITINRDEEGRPTYEAIQAYIHLVRPSIDRDLWLDTAEFTDANIAFFMNLLAEKDPAGWAALMEATPEHLHRAATKTAA